MVDRPSGCDIGEPILNVLDDRQLAIDVSRHRFRREELSASLRPIGKSIQFLFSIGR